MADALARDHVRDFVRSCVRAGLLDDDELLREAERAVSEELPGVRDPRGQAATWVGEFTAELTEDAATWPAITDYHRLQRAFERLREQGIVVLQGCEDHWTAKAALQPRQADPPAGVAWFTPPDVWHAIDEGMLEVNVWHASTANVAPGDALLDQVVAVLAEQGLSAHFDEGRVEVAAHWQRPPEERPPAVATPADAP